MPALVEAAGAWKGVAVAFGLDAGTCPFFIWSTVGTKTDMNFG